MRIRYQNEYTNQISFPLGRIGSGSIGLLGNGKLGDWDISNRPSKGSINGHIIDGESREFTFEEGRVSFPECSIRDFIEIRYKC